MVQVEILVGVVDVKRQLVDNVPELILEDQVVVLAAVSEARHASDGNDHPQTKQRAPVAEKGATEKSFAIANESIHNSSL